MLKKLFISFLISIVFITTVGVRVFTHSCKEDGVFKTYLVKTNNHCEDEKKELPPCCQKEKEKKKDCCHDETEVFKLKVDYVSFWDNFSFELIDILDNQIFKYNKKITPTDKQILQFSNSDPPPNMCGREILLRKQVLII